MRSVEPGHDRSALSAPKRTSRTNPGTPAAGVVSLIVNSGPTETFRDTMRGRTPEGEPTTLIVTRKGLGSAGRTWLTFNGAIRTTVVLTDQEAEQLTGMLGEASGARKPR
ncbi:MAG: hypothetical protein LC799_20145 [Actinobacteria bacterium]|nr:hypothetical protein [Actinomycetota bacterium]